MKITDLEGRRVRLGKTSITCMDEAGKTRGVVRGLRSLDSCRDTRYEWDMLRAMNRAGIFGSRIDGIMSQVFESGGKYYYINNLRALEIYEKYSQGVDGYEQEAKNYAKRLEIARKAAETMTVINCYVERRS